LAEAFNQNRTPQPEPGLRLSPEIGDVLIASFCADFSTPERECQENFTVNDKNG
jgi:hypothetical protein